MAANSLRRESGEILGVLFITISSLALLVCLELSNIETKWLIYILACLLFGAIALMSGNLRKSLVVLTVLGLQAGISLYLTKPIEELPSGSSASTGIGVHFVTIPIIFLFLHSSFMSIKNDRSRFFWGGKTSYCAAFWLLMPTLTIFYAPERTLVVSYVFEQIQFYLIFIVMLNAIQSPIDIDLIVKLLMLNLALQSVIYFLQNLLGTTFTLTGEIFETADGLQRHGGTVSNNPAPYTSFILPLLFIAISRFFITKDRYLCVRMGLLAGMGIAALVLTFTRAAWAGFILGLVWLVAIGMKRRLIPLHRLIPIVIAGVAAILLLLPQVMLRLSYDHVYDYQERLNLTRMAWKVIQAHPLLGVGAGTYGYVFQDYLPPDFKEEWRFIVHNVYLLRWAETGLFGLLSLLGLFYVGVRQALICTRIADETIAALALGSSAGFVALIWEMFWDVSLGPSVNSLIWLLLALLLASTKMTFGTASIATTDPNRPYLSARV